MLHINAVCFAKRPAPALSAFPCIIEECRIGRVLCHYKVSRASCYEVLLDVKPFVHFIKYIRLVCFNPFVFPQRVLHTGGGGVCGRQTFQQHPGVDAGDGKAVGLAAAELLCGPLVPVAHGPAQGVSLPVHQHHALHLGAEGYTGYLRSAHAR